VIFLTGFSDEFYKLKDSDVDADDFTIKAFSFIELAARIRAVLRRTSISEDFAITGNTALSMERKYA
jgi:DNA-binding response OmpR family regulator